MIKDSRPNPVVVGLVFAWRASRERRWSFVAASALLVALCLAVVPVRVALWVCGAVVVLVDEAGMLAERVLQWSDDVDINHSIAVRLFSRLYRSSRFVDWCVTQRGRGLPDTTCTGEDDS